MVRSTRYSRVALTVGVLALLGAAATPGLASAAAKTVLVSQSSSGQKGNDHSGEPSTSKDGQLIAFNSTASNIGGPDNRQCYVRDRDGGGTTELVSGGVAGQCFGAAISQDGHWVAFELDGPGPAQVYLRNLDNDNTELVSHANGGLAQIGNGRSGDPAISADGRYVVFESAATNLLGPGVDTNGVMDVFLWDRESKDIRRVSVRSNGNQANRASTDPAISANGSSIVFSSNATNLVPKDTNGKRDVFIHTRANGKTWRVSLNSKEKQGNGASGNAAVSNDGRWVAFESRASNLVGADKAKDRDVFLRDRKNGKTILVSVNSKGKKGNNSSGDPTISNSGRWIAFESEASNLVGKDPNGRVDSFVRDRVSRTTKIVSRRGNGKPAYGDGDDPFISGNGKFVAFESRARYVVAKDNDTIEDVFLRGPLR